jgi:ABC-2 type transport system permease protein
MTATTAPTTTPEASVEAPVGSDPGFRATFASEWYKLRTSRAPRRNLVLGTVLATLLALVLAMVFGATYDDWSAADKAGFDPILFPLAGSVFPAFFFSAVGVNVVASEYTSGMMRLTLTVSPRRHRVLAAKALVVALATWACGILSVLGTLVLSQFVLRAYDVPSADMASGDFLRTCIAIAAIGPLFPVIAVAVTVLFRSTAAALCTVLALIFGPGIIGILLPEWWQRNVISLLPGPASDSVAISHLDDSVIYRHPVTGAFITVLWVVAFLVLAQVVWSRRDV